MKKIALQSEKTEYSGAVGLIAGLIFVILPIVFVFSAGGLSCYRGRQKTGNEWRYPSEIPRYWRKRQITGGYLCGRHDGGCTFRKRGYGGNLCQTSHLASARRSGR